MSLMKMRASEQRRSYVRILFLLPGRRFLLGRKRNARSAAARRAVAEYIPLEILQSPFSGQDYLYSATSGIFINSISISAFCMYDVFGSARSFADPMLFRSLKPGGPGATFHNTGQMNNLKCKPQTEEGSAKIFSALLLCSSKAIDRLFAVLSDGFYSGPNGLSLESKTIRPPTLRCN